MSVSPNVAPNSSPDAARRGMLLVARVAYAATILGSIGLAAFGVVPRYQILLERAQAQQFEWLTLGPEFYAAWLTGVGGLLLVVFGLVGVILAALYSAERMAALTALTLVLLAVDTSNFPQSLADTTPAMGFPVALVLAIAAALPAIILYLFPDGTPRPKWMIVPLVVIIVWTGVRVATYNTPFYFLRWGPLPVLIYVVLAYAPGVYSQIYRRPHLSEEEKLQTRWVMFGFLTSLALYAVLRGFSAAFPEILPAGGTGDATQLLAGLIAYTVFCIGLVPLLLTLIIAVTRYRLWNLAFVVNRSLVYGAVAALLVVVLGGALVALQQVFSGILADQTQVLIALMLTAAVAGVAFGPLRSRLQRFVDRQIYSIGINYQEKRPTPAPPPTTIKPDVPYIEGFQELRLHARGGMADVYRGRSTRYNRWVAVKVLQRRYLGDKEVIRRFQQEADIMQNLNHPNIILIHDHAEYFGGYYIAMEFMKGEELSDLIQTTGRLSLQECCYVLQDITNALDYIHSRGLVHRDIKPANIMLERVTDMTGKPFRAVLMDFGIARLMQDGHQLTDSGMLGTFDYMSPEQIGGVEQVDHRADVYALGVTAYEMVVGRLPFTNRNPGAVLLAHMRQPPPDPRVLRPDLPDCAALAIMQAMSKNPEERFSSASDFFLHFSRDLDVKLPGRRQAG